MTNTDSTLFSMLTRDRSLRHPTARNFSADEWIKAAKAIENPSDRDIRLLLAAVYYGNEIAILRNTFESDLFANMVRRSATLLSVAMANCNFDSLADKSKQTRKRTGADFVHLGLAGQASVETYPGNVSSPDTAITTIVDTLPHCLERANRCPLECEIIVDNFWKRGAKLFSTMSLEHGLRDLWQLVLWENWEVVKNEDIRRHQPVDQRLATLWHVWVWRHEMILSQGTNLDAVAEKTKELSGQNPEPFLERTAVGIGGSSPETRKFRFGPVSGRTFHQTWHRSELSMLEDSYLAPFLDAPLPGLSNTLTCRDLHKIWCVIRDCANILRDKSRRRSFDDLRDIEAHALVIRREEIERATVQCLAIEADRAKRSIDFLTCDHFDLSSLFTQSFWSAPLLNIDDGPNLAIVLASVEVGSAIRRVESWLNRAGLSDHLSDAQRGLKYEAVVRNEIRESLSANPLLSVAQCAAASVERLGDGEQVDLLVMLGDLLIVGEIKCFLYPIEPTEHFNYLKRLDEAGGQATRKANWLRNPHVVADALQITSEMATSLRPVPIVVTNQGACFGLEANGARVIDFHFLKLYLSDNEYISGMTFDAEKGIAVRYPETLYRDGTEAARRFETTMADPPPLRRLLQSAIWKDSRFPSSDGQDLLVANCYPDDSMVIEAKERAAILLKKRRRQL